MKYSDWCIDYYKRKHPDFQEEQLDARKRYEIKRTVTEPLLARLNYLTGKYYGVGREFDILYYVTDEEDVMEKAIGAHYKSIELLRKDYEDTINKREKEMLKNRELKKGEVPKDKLDGPVNEDKKKNKKEEAEKKRDALENRGIEGAYITKRRFECISQVESAFFEFLLTVISKDKLRKIKNDKWEEIDWEDRKLLIKLLHEIESCPEWQLSKEDIKYIEFKLTYPIPYRMIMIQDVIEGNMQLENKNIVSEHLNCIRENVDSLYEIICEKECSENLTCEALIMDRLKEENPIVYNAMNKMEG